MTTVTALVDEFASFVAYSKVTGQCRRLRCNTCLVLKPVPHTNGSFVRDALGCGQQQHPRHCSCSERNAIRLPAQKMQMLLPCYYPWKPPIHQSVFRPPAHSSSHRAIQPAIRPPSFCPSIYLLSSAIFPDNNTFSCADGHSWHCWEVFAVWSLTAG